MRGNHDKQTVSEQVPRVGGGSPAAEGTMSSDSD